MKASAQKAAITRKPNNSSAGQVRSGQVSAPIFVFRCALVVKKKSPKFRQTQEKGAKFREFFFLRKRAEISKKIVK